MFQILFTVITFNLNLLEKMLEDPWNNRLYLGIRSIESWVGWQQWAYYIRWYRVRAWFYAPFDSNLRRVLSLHLLFVRGHLSEPTVEEGVPFLCVGRNASHEFYLGVVEGRLFRMSVGEEFVEDGEPMPVQENGESWEDFDDRLLDWETRHRDFLTRVQEVASDEDWGYLGHC